MAMKTVKCILSTVLFSFLLSGCLTAEFKEYIFELTGKNSGKLTIRYVNIMSKSDSDEMTKEQELNKDYTELVEKYINGDELEKKYPNAKITGKRLFEQNGKLCGEVVLQFASLDQVQLYQHEGNGPVMFLLQSLSSETFNESNGVKGPEFLPVVFWDNKIKKLTLKTSIVAPDEKTTSLLAKWKESKK
jgi:hypothetical protein